MNDIFGIEVRRRLFPAAPKRKRKSKRPPSDGGMLANLAPLAATKKRKKQQPFSVLMCGGAAKDSTDHQSSVLADIGNCKSPPRSNKELKETRSSAMANDYGSDKKDVSFSVFEMISQRRQDQPDATSRQSRPSRKRRHGRPTRTQVAVSVLAAAAAPQDEGVQQQHAESVLVAAAPQVEGVQQQRAESVLAAAAAPQDEGGQQQHAESVLVTAAAPQDEGVQQQHAESVLVAAAAPQDEGVQQQHAESVLVAAAPQHEGVQQQHADSQGIKRRGKRDRHAVVSRETKKPRQPKQSNSASSEVWYDCVEHESIIPDDKTNAGEQVLASLIAVKSAREGAIDMKSAREEETKTTIRQGSTKRANKKKPRNEANSKPCGPEHQEFDVDSLDHPAKTQYTRTLKTPQEKHHKDYGPSAHVLSVHNLDVSIVEEAAIITLLQLATSQSEDEEEKVSFVDEAAVIMLLQLSASKSEDEEEQVHVVQKTKIEERKHVAVKRKTKGKTERTKSVATKRKKSTSPSKEPTRRSTRRSTSPSNEPTRRSTRHSTSPSNESKRRSTRQAAVTQRFSPIDSRTRRRSGPRSNTKKNLESVEEVEATTRKRAETTQTEEELPKEAIVGPLVAVVKVSRKRAVAAVDSPCQRKSSRPKTQTMRYTPPKKVSTEDDFFESVQKYKPADSESDDDEIEQKRQVTRSVESAADKRRPSKETKGAKTNHTAVENRSKSEKPDAKTNYAKSMTVKHAVIEHDSKAADPDGWRSLQIASLRNAYAAVDPRSGQFWQEVASQVEGQDVEECRKKWFALVKTPEAKKKLTTQAKRNNGQVLVQGNPDEDDLFNATPMKSQLYDDDDSERDDQERFDFGSPIVDGGHGRINNMTEYDDETENISPPGRLGYSKTYVKNLKRDITKAGKEKQKKRRPIGVTCPRVLSGAVDYGDIEVKGSLTPGGTVRMRTIDWNEGDEDDFFDSEDEEM